MKYPGTSSEEVCSFVGSHMDVVPADPSGWQRDPFTLTIEGDELFGRGTTGLRYIVTIIIINIR